MAEQHFGRAYGGNAAENYERYFVPVIGAPMAEQLVDAAALRAGERVLDVACGTGVATRLAAARVGATGKVAGLDLNPGMLAVARAVPSSGDSIEWHEASAEAMPLPDETFDVVLCALGLQFVPDKPAAVREMRRVLKPGGRLAISVPGELPPLFAVVDEALDRHVGQGAGRFVRAVFSLHDPDEIRGLFDRAGFDDVNVRPGTKTLRLPPPEEFFWQYIHSTPLGGMLADMDDHGRGAMERDVVAGLQDFVEDGGLAFRHDPIVVTARR